MKRHTCFVFGRCFFLLPVTLFWLTACAAVGPDHIAPEPRAPVVWNTVLPEGLEGGAPDERELARWWRVFDDAVLSELVQKAAGANFDLAQAKARVQEARARRGFEQTDLEPTLDASGSASRGRSGGRQTRLHSIGFDAGWEIDIFGGLRRSIEAAEGDLSAAEAGLANVRVTLAAEIGRNYIEVRTTQNRLQVARANLKVQQETYNLTRSRFEAGLNDALDVERARYNLESTRSQIPSLENSLAASFNRLAVLTGEAPGAVDKLLAEVRPVPAAMPAVAVGIPAETLRRRPDVRQAERQLAAQTARIGVAEADLYPRLRLAGAIGLSASNSNDWLHWANRAWNLGPSLSWNIFDAGAVRRNIEVRNAVQAQSLSAYEATVLAALEEVENALSTYLHEQVRCDHLAAAVDAARQAEFLARHKYESGLADFSDVLEAQRSLLSFQDQLAGGRGKVAANLIALYKALGGGWESLPDSGGS